MPDLSIWSDIATIVSAVLAIVALVFVWHQIRQVAKAQESGSRSYLSARLELGTSRERQALFLVLKNHGRTPAIDIHIEFDHANNWHYVEHWQKFPFVGDNRVLQLLPDEERKFFLGTMVKDSRLLALKTDEATGNLFYSDALASERKEAIRLTLKDMVFVAR
ncbi:MAG: hypothetical protein EBZ87_03775 [Microbacteriaceae bacterium]|nr:hypothetical protein [Microbacteriaceae bacterium]